MQHCVQQTSSLLEFAASQVTTLRAALKHDVDNEHGTQDM